MKGTGPMGWGLGLAAVDVTRLAKWSVRSRKQDFEKLGDKGAFSDCMIFIFQINMIHFYLRRSRGHRVARVVVVVLF